mmetsp:Transcript_20105/g.50588  ORF Transcript_20105/g.50588 Transcript_20105/m.50588 type:complete len:226 (-) Transcript_20105:398-1075(-)
MDALLRAAMAVTHEVCNGSGHGHDAHLALVVRIGHVAVVARLLVRVNEVPSHSPEVVSLVEHLAPHPIGGKHHEVRATRLFISGRVFNDVAYFVQRFKLLPLGVVPRTNAARKQTQEERHHDKGRVVGVGHTPGMALELMVEKDLSAVFDAPAEVPQEVRAKRHVAFDHRLLHQVEGNGGLVHAPQPLRPERGPGWPLVDPGALPAQMQPQVVRSCRRSPGLLRE